MAELATVTVSSKESEAPASTDSNQILAAAIETGKAVEQANQAAREAQAAASEAKAEAQTTPNELMKLREELRTEIAELAETIGNLQQVTEAEAEELEEAEEKNSEADDTPALALASAVEIDVPKEEKRNPKSIQMTAPKQDTKSARSVLGRIFLGK